MNTETDVPTEDQRARPRRSRSMITSNPYQSKKTHCPRGHAYTPENTKLARSTRAGHFKRQCRACKAAVAARAHTFGKLAKAAMRCEPITDPAAAAVLAEAFGEGEYTAGNIMQAIAIIKDREKAERAATSEAKRAARLQRKRLRDQGRRRSEVSTDTTAAPVDQHQRLKDRAAKLLARDQARRIDREARKVAREALSDPAIVAAITQAVEEAIAQLRRPRPDNVRIRAALGLPTAPMRSITAIITHPARSDRNRTTARAAPVHQASRAGIPVLA